MAYVFNMIGGEARTGLRSLIVVTAPTGSTVTCDGTAGTESSGKWTFPVELGTHTIVGTKDEKTETKSVNVDTVGQYSVKITYTSRLYLYSEGDECTDITGGWISGKFITDYGDRLGTATKYDTKLYCIAGSSGSLVSIGWFTTNTIDITEYSKLCFNVTDYYRGYAVRAGCNTNRMYALSGGAFSDPSGTGLLEIDISSLTDDYYIMFGCWAYGSYIGCDAIWLE